MSIIYEGIVFDTVEQLVKYQRMTGKLPEHINVRMVPEKQEQREESKAQEDEEREETKPEKQEGTKEHHDSHYWTEEEDDALMDIYGTENYQERLRKRRKFEKKYNRTKSAIYTRARKLGISGKENRSRKDYTKEELDAIKEVYKTKEGERISRKKLKRLAAKLGRSTRALTKKASDMGWTQDVQDDTVKKSVEDYVDEETLRAAKQKSSPQSSWSSEEIKLLRKAYAAKKDGYSNNEVVAFLKEHLKRTEGAIRVRASVEGFSSPDYPSSSSSSSDKEEIDVEEKEGAYMLRKKPRDPFDMDKARQKALYESTVTHDEFPNIYPVAERSKPQLQALVKHVIANRGKISKFDVESCCELQKSYIGNGKDWWSGRTWLVFCQQFMLNSKKIADYFSVKDHFKMVREKGYHVIRYSP